MIDQSIAFKGETNTKYIYCDGDIINLFLRSACDTT
jgi:hypothetical protein